MKRALLLSAVVGISMLLAPTSFGRTITPQIAPIQSHPYGQTYGEWAADWWQVALETTDTADLPNPLLDTTGVSCEVGDMGNVWFLFGTFLGDAIVRDCAVPTGTAIFFPLVNSFYGRFEGDKDTEEEARESAACVEDATLHFEFNGTPVPGLDRYFEESAVFQVRFPETDAVFGLDDVFLDLAVDAGFYLFLRPLPPGSYTLHWTASSQACDVTQDITYNLTVKRGRS